MGLCAPVFLGHMAQPPAFWPRFLQAAVASAGGLQRARGPRSGEPSAGGRREVGSVGFCEGECLELRKASDFWGGLATNGQVFGGTSHNPKK